MARHFLFVLGMYFSHAFCVRRSLFTGLGGFREGFEGSQDYDFALRATERARSVIHAGVLLGAFALTHHLLQGRPADFRGYRNRGMLTHAVSAVTAACAVIRLDLFDTLGGFDEALPAAYNDIDLCLASGARGHYNIVVNRPLVHHFESASRGYYLRPEQEAADRAALNYLLGKWGDGVRADPFYNPNLALDRENYTLAYPPRVPAEHAFRFAFADREPTAPRRRPATVV